jgi:hypothetical protein
MILFSCQATHITIGVNEEAPIIIYKTTHDYSSHVPVIMNEEKDRIVSYPAPSDLLYKGELMLPVKLKKGYLLDRRGIHPNAVFTAFTYQEYVQLERSPTPDLLQDHIIDMNPFISIYHCGKKSDFTNLEKELNRLISKHFEGYKSLITR